MTWNSLFKPLDARVTLSAPSLTMLAICLVVAVIMIDVRLSQSKSEMQVIAVTTEEDDTDEEVFSVALPDELWKEVEAFIQSSKTKPITRDSLTSAPFFSELDPTYHAAVTAFTGEELSRRHRYLESVDLFKTLSPDERTALGSSFAYGFALRALDRNEEALESYRQHVSAYPNHQAGNINLGLLLAKMERHAEAITVLHHAAEISSGERRGKALSAQGSSLAALGRHAEAVPVFSKSIEYRPDHSATWRKFAMSMNSAENYDQTEIESAFQKSIALAPHNSVPRTELGHFYFGKGRFRDAISVYREAHNLAKDRLSVGLHRALNLYISERPKSAERILRKIRRTKRSANQSRQFELLEALIDGSDNHVAEATEELSVSRTRGEELTEALLVLAKIKSDIETVSETELEAFADSTTFYLPLRYSFAQELLAKGQYEAAARQLEFLTQRSDQSPSFAYAYSLSLRGLGRTNEALEAVAHAFELQPESDRISYELVDQEIAANNYDAALKVLDQVIARKKRPIEAYIKSGELYLAQNKLKNAIEMYSQVVALGKSDLDIMLKLADLQSRAGKQGDALITIDAAIERESNSIDARLLRSQILIKTKNEEGAIEELNRILRLDEDCQPAQVLLTKLQSNAM